MGTKAALITGSARRIGRAIAVHLASEGWDIAAHYNTSQDEALSLQAEVQAAGVDCELYPADLNDPAAADDLVQRCVDDFPHASLLVNSASIFKKDTVAIGKRIAGLLEPHFLRIGGYWYPRGGMPIDVFWQTGKLPEGVWLPDQGVAPYRGRG